MSRARDISSGSSLLEDINITLNGGISRGKTKIMIDRDYCREKKVKNCLPPTPYIHHSDALHGIYQHQCRKLIASTLVDSLLLTFVQKKHL